MANKTLTKKSKDDSNQKINPSAAVASGMFQRLAARFNFVFGKDKETGDQQLVITHHSDLLENPKSEPHKELEEISAIVSNYHLSDTCQMLLDSWLQDSTNSYANIEDRQERINELIFMVDNEPACEAACRLTADECTSSSSDKVISVVSTDEEFQKKANSWLDDWDISAPVLNSIAFSIEELGEAFLGCEWTNKGCVSTSPLKASDIAERLEFSPMHALEYLAQANTGSSTPSRYVNGMQINHGAQGAMYQSRESLFDEYLNNISDMCHNELFKKHLLGYRLAVGDKLLPPWQVMHFRFRADTSEFYPYGRPPLLACLPAFKLTQKALGLEELRETLNLPLTLYKVKTQGATTTRAWDIVNETRQRFEKTGSVAQTAGYEGPSQLTSMWMSDELLSVEKVGGQDAGSNAKADLLKFFEQRVEIATGIPRTYLDPGAEGFQMSGVALAALYKPFNRHVHAIRDCIVDTINDFIKLQASFLGIKIPDYAVVLNVDVAADQEQVNSGNEIVNTVMGQAGILLGCAPEELPRKVKQDILLRYTMLTDSDIESWQSLYDKYGKDEAAAELSQEDAGASLGGDGGGFDLGGGDDLGGDLGGGDEAPAAEAARVRKNKRLLIESRYNAINKNQLPLMLLKETDKVYTKHALYYSGSRKSKDKCLNEAVAFLKKSTLKRALKENAGE